MPDRSTGQARGPLQAAGWAGFGVLPGVPRRQPRAATQGSSYAQTGPFRMLARWFTQVEAQNKARARGHSREATGRKVLGCAAPPQPPQGAHLAARGLSERPGWAPGQHVPLLGLAAPPRSAALHPAAAPPELRQPQAGLLCQPRGAQQRQPQPHPLQPAAAAGAPQSGWEQRRRGRLPLPAGAQLHGCCPRQRLRAARPERPPRAQRPRRAARPRGLHPAGNRHSRCGSGRANAAAGSGTCGRRAGGRVVSGTIKGQAGA